MLLHTNMYFLLALVFVLLGITTADLYFRSAWGWAALSFFVVSLAYIFNNPSIFRKRADGSIPLSVRWTLWPFLWATQCFNAIARSRDKEPAIQEVEPGLFLARRLFPSDIHFLKSHNICAVLDVTAEFNSLNWTLLGEGIDYLNVPILDHSTPSEVQVKRALNWIHTHRKGGRSVIVHCALGRGRSVFMMAAYLLSQHSDRTVAGVIKQIKSVRKSAHLNKRQFHKLSTMHHKGALRVHNTAWLIANPVAGTRQWQQSKEQIIELLSPYYDLTIRTTSEKHNGSYWAQKALRKHPDVIIACGGDGTVAEVAQELVNTQVKLGIIPLGTANALSYALCGFGVKINPVKTACMALIEGVESRIDTAICNDEVMLLLCGVGFEQQMIEKADRAKKNNSGQLAYLQGLSEAVGDNKSTVYKVQMNDQEVTEINTPSLTIANAAPVTTLLAQGRGAPDLMDGEMDLTWLSPDRAQILNLLELVGHGLTNRYEAHDYEGVHHATAYRVKLEAKNGELVSYVLDGENREAEQLVVEVMPKSLSVMVPAKSASVKDTKEENEEEAL
ncbi:diacylglycerol kinase family protein [Marinomonas fungiae]|uniref:Diacylglycerol kinase family enzyme n=1 Tax=Marinomonas fungiae TaxID=1137284 RepID=A0A0K6IMM9_9GAMM|nr:diacylglycerol kinase family protein [Marinomonas fungiae]CUB04353.1 Diacylglycerol kinase family enzyme [Marinomonas fungiae]